MKASAGAGNLSFPRIPDMQTRVLILHFVRCTSSPVHRVHDASVAALMRQGGETGQVEDDGPKQLDMRPLIKCKLAEAQAKLTKSTIHHISVVSVSKMLGNNKNSQNNMRTQLEVYQKCMQGAVDAAAEAVKLAAETKAYRCAFQAHMLGAHIGALVSLGLAMQLADMCSEAK